VRVRVRVGVGVRVRARVRARLRLSPTVLVGGLVALRVVEEQQVLDHGRVTLARGDRERGAPG